MYYFKGLMFVLMLNIVLGAGAQGLSIPIAGFPLTVMDMFLFIGVFRLLARLVRGKRLFLLKEDALITIIAIIALVRAAYNIYTNGFSAIRDCTHYMDMLFIPIFYFELRDAEKKIDLSEYIKRWFIRTKDFVFYYALLLPLKPILVSISPKGFGAQSSIPIFGSFTITHLWLLVIVMVNTYAIVKGYVFGKKRQLYIIQSIISLILTVYSSSRITMLTFVIFIIISIYNNRKIMHRMVRYLLLGGSVLLLLAIFGISFNTSRGTFSISNILDLFLSIFGDESAGYSGYGLRMGFFSNVIENHSSLDRILFGGGFGYPLINFGAETGANVREPHCSYLSVYARNGIIILGLWLIFLIRKFRIAIKTMNRNMYGYILFTILISCLINATCETFFETPCEASAFYGLVAICSYMSLYVKKVKIGMIKDVAAIQ